MLTRKQHFTELVVRDAHDTVKHASVKETLMQARSQYWIVGGHSLVRSTIYKCVKCCRYDSLPHHGPPPPPLPAFIVNEGPPLTFTGVDNSGPPFVRAPGVVEDNTYKVWICQFSFCVTRALHLELVLDMSAPTFL